MKVFVSGVAGFLGSHLADAFLGLGHEVIGCDNMIGGDRENVPPFVEFFEADCTDVESMRRLTDGAELVYHCAAVATEGLSVFSPALISQHVYQNTAGLLAGSLAGGLKRFVFCSSMARYGAGPIPFREDQPTRPQDPYGIAKYAAELLVANLCETYGVEYTIAVPHNIIGSRQKYDDPYRNVASIMVNRMLQGQQPIIYGDGQQKRCFSFVQDCIDPLVEMGCAPGLNGQVINIGPDDPFITVQDLAEILADLLDFDLDPIYVSERPREVKFATCSADKARDILGYEPKVSLQDGLRSIIDWVREKGTKPFQYHLPIEIHSDLVPETWSKRLF